LVQKDAPKVDSKNLAGAVLSAKAAGSKAIKVRQRQRRTNWFKPETWNAIEQAARICGFRTSDMIRYLRAQAGGHKTYCSLAPGTITKWIDKSGEAPRWYGFVLEKVESCGKRDQSKILGRPRVLVSNLIVLALTVVNNTFLGGLSCRCKQNQEGLEGK
jgi:hypothetical protein